jgi:4-hydroxy-tetrahydrodipicolinate reductase
VKILLIGYGKMGQIIERLAIERGHEIAAKYNSQHPFTAESCVQADVAIEFSSPELAVDHLKLCIENQIPIITGTTGWYSHYDDIKAHCNHHNSAIFTATNFSLGVNLFFEMSKRLTQLMTNQPYKLSIEEIHHTEKKDAPSGTAITLAETVISASNILKNWDLINDKPSDEFENQSMLPIKALRIEGVPGTHSLQFESEVDIITLEHEAKSRLGFATGAVVAAEWIVGKTGVFGMRDLLNFEN